MAKDKVVWHSFPAQEAVKKLGSNAQAGLSFEEVKARQKKFGQNKFPEKEPSSGLGLFLSQLKSPLMYILILVGFIVIFLEDYPSNVIQSGFVLAAVFINALFGFWEENKASRTFEELKKILKTGAVAVRDGGKKEVLQEEIVPGDIVVFSPGDKIPADGRLIESQDLRVSEAALTGEWIPASKNPEVLPENTPLADRDNMVFSGCLVENGRGKAVVVATGLKTEIGRIASLVEEAQEGETPLQKKLARFSKLIGGAIGAACFFIFVAGLARQQNPIEMFETAAAIAVGGIPEALPVVMTVILATGMGRLARKKGLVRKLASVETLGSTSVICTDKTKTLTQGKMVADRVVGLEEDFEIKPEIKNNVFVSALEIAVLCNEAFIENPEASPEYWRIGGTPTDKALLLAGTRNGILKPELEKRNPVLKSLPFDTSRKYEAALVREGRKLFLYVSGAPEKVLELSSRVAAADQEKKLEGELSELNSKLQQLTEKGRRVIAVAKKEVAPELEKEIFDKNEDQPLHIRDLTFFGFISLKDPLRPHVKEALALCQKAGMTSVIITGDHKTTARAVAEELGIKIKKENIVEGSELDQLSDQDLAAKIRKIKIYARAEPRHKIRIVRAWQRGGEVVAMTGDGVNDAPALKSADIGLALGSGTDVAKEASDLVLLNDSFNIIVGAVEEGRVILDNIRKAIAYILADSFTSVILVGFSILFGWPLPILWTQILWNNIVEDTLPDIAYAFEPKEKGVMERKPASPSIPLLTREMKFLIFITGLIDEFIILVLFWILWAKLGLGLDYVRTMVFGAICIDTAFVVYSYKNLRKNIWQINLFNNKFLLAASLVVFLAFAAAVYAPPLQALLQTVPLGPGSWLLLIGVAVLSVLLIEITKHHFIVKKQT